MWFGEGKVAYQRDRILPSDQSQLLIEALDRLKATLELPRTKPD